MISSFLAGRRSILFDMDDTLYPERSFVLSGFHTTAVWLESQTGLAALTTEPVLVELFTAGVRGDTFDQWLARLELPVNDWRPALIEIYRSHEPNIAPFPGIVELLAQLKQEFTLGLVSDGTHATQRRKLAVLGVGPYFDSIVFSDMWGRSAWKPNPRPFIESLRNLGLQGSQAVYVADNPAKDFIGARRLGIKTVRLRHADGIYAEAEPPTPSHAADAEVSDVDGLEKLLRE